MPWWQSLFFQPLGTQILGKVSWWMKHLKRSRVCPAKRLLWRCPSRRLLRVGYPLLPLLPHLPHQDQGHAGEWISGGQSRPLAPASMPSLSVTVAGCYDQYTRWSVSFFNSHQCTITVAIARLSVVEFSMKALPRLLLSKAEVFQEMSQVDRDWLLWADPRLALTPEDTEFFTNWFSQ